jgi:antitoxin VapB
MALNIKSEKTEQLARRLVKLRGRSPTDVIVQSLESEWQRERRKKGSVAKELLAIGDRLANVKRLTDGTPEEIIGYDEFGLPR